MTKTTGKFATTDLLKNSYALMKCKKTTEVWSMITFNKQFIINSNIII